jgi:Ca2+/Na+ antiporter
VLPVLFIAAPNFFFYGDEIARLAGMGMACAGLILMASVTSLPELITAIGSVVTEKIQTWQPEIFPAVAYITCSYFLYGMPG